jgi:hypothetical protein
VKGRTAREWRIGVHYHSIPIPPSSSLSPTLACPTAPSPSTIHVCQLLGNSFLLPSRHDWGRVETRQSRVFVIQSGHPSSSWCWSGRKRCLIRQSSTIPERRRGFCLRRKGYLIRNPIKMVDITMLGWRGDAAFGLGRKRCLGRKGISPDTLLRC